MTYHHNAGKRRLIQNAIFHHLILAMLYLWEFQKINCHNALLAMMKMYAGLVFGTKLAVRAIAITWVGS
jgi:hypothetical protein